MKKSAAFAQADNLIQGEKCDATSVGSKKKTISIIRRLTSNFAAMVEDTNGPGNDVFWVGVPADGNDTPTHQERIVLQSERESDKQQSQDINCLANPAFSTTIFSFGRLAKVVSINSQLGKELGLRAGDEFAFSCHSFISTPIGPDIDDQGPCLQKSN